MTFKAALRFGGEPVRAIRPKRRMQVKIWIADLIACRPVTDHQQRHVALRPVDEPVRVAGAGGKAGAHPWSQHLRAVIGLQHDLALEHIDEFVLARMGVPERGLSGPG